MSSSHYFSSETTFLDAQELESFRQFALESNEKMLSFVSAPAVFSRNEFDVGSQILLENFLITVYCAKAAKLCDLGCGWGPIAAFLGAHHEETQVYAVDSNPRAAQVARYNFERNHLKNCVAWCGDGLDATPDQTFDYILCNPPVRAGNAVIEKLFADSQRTLKPEGELWIVLRTAQGAKSWQKKLENQFGCCETMEISRGFRVLRCHRANSTSDDS